MAAHTLAEELYRRILAAVPAGVVHVDMTGAIRDANAEAARILGLTFDQLTRKYIAGFQAETIHEDGTPCRVEEYPVARCLVTGQPQPPLIIGVRRPDGAVSWCNFAAVPVHDPATGAQSGAVATFPDITLQKQTAASARASEQRLKSVLASAPDCIVNTDRAGNILFFNRAPPTLEPKALAGRSIFELVSPADEPALRADFEHVLMTGAVIRGEITLQGPVSSCALAASFGPVRDGDAIVGVTIVTGDLTGHRAVESRLAIADRMASLGQLAAGVAHEINNPLTYLLGSLDWLARRVEGDAPLEPAQLRSMFGAAMEGATRIRTIVRDLGTFSHAADQQPAQLDVRPMLESALRMAHGELRCRARVVREYGDVPKVWASDARLGQVFLNLVVNAAQAIAEGDVEHNEIRVVTCTDAGGRAVIEITDTGAGIEPELVDRIFDPFVTSKAAGVGTGLGLFICRSIVNSLGGDITVTSRQGQGSRFRVVLPVGHAPRASSVPQPVARAPQRRMRVLVVDDEPGVLGLLRQLLDHHDVSTARTGREALTMLAERDFDAVLCDLVMPDLTGMDVYDQLRQQGRGREDRMVFMTGGAFTRRAREFLEMLPGRVVEKPFTASAIEQALAGLG